MGLVLKALTYEALGSLGILKVPTYEVQGGLRIVELADGVSEDDMRAATEATIL